MSGSRDAPRRDLQLPIEMSVPSALLLITSVPLAKTRN
jgi:hypothetical protein